MLLDARHLASGEVIEVDVCIVGSGPAGLTLASELAGTGRRIAVLESGGAEPEPRLQEASEFENLGTPLTSGRKVRRRQLGGNSNAWNIELSAGPPVQHGVRYLPFDAYDFEPRPWMAHSGWPIGRDELEPYYVRAQRLCGLGASSYETQSWEDADARPLRLDEERVVSGMFQFGPSAVFHEQHRERLKQHEDVTLYLHATVQELTLDAAGEAITRARVASVPGHHFQVQAKQFVLCAGAMENARLLLLSNRQQPRGLGNQHDLVGRFFMDHPLVDAGLFRPRDPALFARMGLYDVRFVNGRPAMGRLAVAQPRMRSEQLLNATAYLFPRPSPRRASALNAAGAFKAAVLARELPKRPLRSLLSVATGMDYVLYAAYLRRRTGQSVLHRFARGGWSKSPLLLDHYESFRVLLQTEQRPDPENRVSLAEARDPWGARKLALRWQWSDDDRRRILRSQQLLAEALAPHGAMHVKTDADGLPKQTVPAGLAHHMGTTRMHADPRHGVVDSNCRVHGLANLFIAGNSVFPTGGCANPTLTLVALTARLADHLQQR